MSTSGVFMYYRWWGCQSAKPWKYTVLNGNFVSDLGDFDFRDIFQECVIGVKRQLPVRSHYSFKSSTAFNFVHMMHCISFLPQS